MKNGKFEKEIYQVTHGQKKKISDFDDFLQERPIWTFLRVKISPQIFHQALVNLQ